MAKKNVVEVAIQGIDEATRVFNKISSNADKSFAQIESTIDSVPDVDIDAFVDGSRAEKQLNDIESTANEVESSIKAIPDPQIDSGKAEKELADVEKQAGETKEAINDIDFGAIVGGLAAGGGLAGAVDKALDMSSLDTKIDISFNVPKESIKSVKQATKTVQSYGLDAEESLEGVRRQFALNSDASDEANRKIVEGAGMIASSYNGIDFTELIQEVNEIGSELNITDEQALGLTNSLLQVGFPPEQLDIIAEYGKQLTDAGYSAEEVQAIMQSGVETGTWNIDNLLDGLKEGRILIGEFGAGVDDATAELLEGTGISSKQLQEWGQAVSQGGEGGKQAMQEVAQALTGVDDETTRNLLGVKLFGTMYEDQGQNIIDTLLNAESATVDLKEGQDAVNESVKQLESTPAVEMKQAMNDITTATAPLFSGIANVVSGIANWISQNPTLSATIMAVTTVLGILMGIFMAVSPIITAITTAASLFGVTMGAIASPVLIVIGVITALIAIIVLLWQNWDSVSQWLSDSWNWLKETAVTVFSAIGEFLSNTWQSIKNVATNLWTGIKSFFVSSWNSIKKTATSVFQSIGNFISKTWNTVKSVSSSIWNGIVSLVTGFINRLKSGITNIFNGIKNIISNVWNAVKNVTSTIWNGIKSVILMVINGIRKSISSVFNSIRNTISSIWNGVRNITSSVWNGIKNAIRNAVNTAKSIVSNVFSSMKTAVSNTLNRILSTVTNIWGKVNSFFSGIDLYSIGKNIIQGLINGVKAMAGKVVDSVKGVVDSAIDGAKKLLGIASPSKLFFGFGEFVDEGFIGGLLSMVRQVGKAGEEMVNAAVPTDNLLFDVGYNPTEALIGGYGNVYGGSIQDMGAIIVNELRKLFGKFPPDHNNSGRGEPTEIVVPINIDGKEVARVTAPYMDRELGKKRISKSRAEGDSDIL